MSGSPRGGLQWPCPAENHPGTPILHRDAFAHGGRAPLQPIEYRETSEIVTPQYPFVLITGRSLYQFNAGTMTGRTANNELRPSDTLNVSPLDTARLGIQDGENVRLVSRYGAATLPVTIDSRMKAGELFATLQTPAIRLNNLTGRNRDASVGTPEYKVTAVRVERQQHD